MRRASKGSVVAIIAAFTLSFATAPANAYAGNEDPETAFAATTGQTLVTVDSDLASESLDALSVAISTDSLVVGHHFDVKAAIAQARSEIGTSRPTGWNQPGECLISAKRWINAGGGAWVHGGTPVNNYQNATRLPISAAMPGDVIQYEYIASPHSWAAGVHTMLVTGVNDDGTLQIIESNNPGGSGLVSENTKFTPNPPAGFQAVVWRF
ncbi:lipase [Canibacter zhoujuaniae]|uniref:lipase n=1 Tax=Canibacter zhoujuaniae TaxID=2708343 RepID=UPI00141FC5A9|nr:lipase [Canibacter zhoujuaniae]